MLMISGPIIALLALLGFLFETFYTKAPERPKSSTVGNAMLFHDAMYSYAIGSLTSVTTPYLITGNPPYFSNINFSSFGDYQANILTDPNTQIQYLISSFSIINNNTSSALTTLNSISGQLQIPTGGFNQNYQVKIVLVNSNCNANILNSGLNAGNYNIDPAIYSSIFSRICQTTQSTNPIKTCVIMEPLQ